MNLIDKLAGTWTGFGQMYNAETKEVIDTMQVEISLSKMSESVLSGDKTMNFMNQKENSYDIGIKIEVKNDMELEFTPEWSDKPIAFMYMENPVSFQGAYVTESLGKNTRNLDNNFIIENQWQINIEAQSEDKHIIFEYALDKEDGL